MQLYLTPAAIGYLTQLILTVLLSGYFLRLAQQPGRPRHTALLAGCFTALAAFVAALFVEVTSMPTLHFYAVGMQNSLLGIALVCLLQFAYCFPAVSARLRREARWALALSALYTLFEAGFGLYRLAQLWAGRIEFRPPWSDYALLLVMLWVPLAFARQLCALSPATGGRAAWLDPWLRPANRDAYATRAFALITFFAAVVSVFNILRGIYVLAVAAANLLISLGILLALFAFAVAYLNHRPETTSFMIKLAGTTLTAVLALFGLAGWILAPPFAAHYRPDLPAHRTLRFAPNGAGGYDVAEIPFAFETATGRKLQLTEYPPQDCSAALDFAFPFYGQDYAQVYACNDGTVSMGRRPQYRDYQNRYGGGAPLIMALLLDLYPEIGPGGVFVREEPGRLIVTWDRVRGFRRTEETFTFQATLYRDGAFELSYLDLPVQLSYDPNDDPGASVWAIGAVPGGLERSAGPQWVSLNALPLRGGPDGVVRDYFLEFRAHLNELLVPLAWLILAAGVLIVAGFPLLFYVNLVRPLNTLVGGVRRLEAGDYAAAVPVQYSDEIGFVTRAFNTLAGRLGDLVRNLEARVVERTAELSRANTLLQTEIRERQEAQALVVHHQRALAALEERERLGRELHDDLGQTLGFINLQVQAAREHARKGNTAAAQQTWDQVLEAAQQAHAGVRGFILGLKAATRQGFHAALRQTLADFERATAIAVDCHVPEPWDEDWLSPVGELNLLRIVQEALNNVRKHARAQSVTLTIERDGDRLRVVVADDGLGLEPDGAEREPGHFGIKGMHERAAELAGTLEIRSVPGRGARVVLECPLQPAPEPLSLPAGPLRVVLVDDHPMFLEGLRNLLAAHGMKVVGLGADGQEAQELARALRPDLIVMDLQMPRCDGLEATRRIKAEWPEARIVILTVSAAEEHIFAALKAGAAGYLLKNMNAEDFFLLLSGLEQGAPPIAPELASRIEVELAQAAQAGTSAALSPQHTEVLKLVGQGLTYREVARQLHLSEATIKYHMKQILERLHLGNRAQAEAYARRSGLVAEEDVVVS